jgi:hypothetical protein
MREILERRRDELSGELDRGERLLAELRTRQSDVRADLLRISGALQVLDELLASDACATEGGPVLHRVGAG